MTQHLTPMGKNRIGMYNMTTPTDTPTQTDDNDPIGNAYAKGYAEGYKRSAIAHDDAVKPLVLCIAESRDALLAGKRCAEVLIQAGGAVAVEIYEEELPLINKALASAAGLVEEMMDALVRKMHTYLFQEPNVNDIDANAEEKHANNRAVEAMINVVRAHFNAAAGEK